MPIEGRTVLDASRLFSEHLNRLLNTTLTKTRIVAFESEDSGRVAVSFREKGNLVPALLSTRYGPMTLAIYQVCQGIPTQSGGQSLATTEYRYTLTQGDRAAWEATEPIFRWEYVRDPQGGRWCRHHLQGTVPVSIGRHPPVIMNDWHLPTGWVTIEEVIRFCIMDLAVDPLSSDWHAILEESYAKLRDEFVNPR